VAWDNASQAILERSLDDSANRRTVLAEAFLAVDELLRRTTRIVAEMAIDAHAIGRNMAVYGPFAATERVLMALVAAGGSRQDGHEWIREASMIAWERLRLGQENNLAELLAADERITRFVPPDEVVKLMDASAHTGTAVSRARALAKTIQQQLTINS
jgi:adenylosuccinate lyase